MLTAGGTALTGATLGVAALGSAFAWGGGGSAGLRAAMISGGLVQLAGALVAWRTIRPAAIERRAAEA